MYGLKKIFYAVYTTYILHTADHKSDQSTFKFRCNLMNGLLGLYVFIDCDLKNSRAICLPAR